MTCDVCQRVFEGGLPKGFKLRMDLSPGQEAKFVSIGILPICFEFTTTGMDICEWCYTIALKKSVAELV